MFVMFLTDLSILVWFENMSVKILMLSPVWKILNIFCITKHATLYFLSTLFFSENKTQATIGITWWLWYGLVWCLVSYWNWIHFLDDDICIWETHSYRFQAYFYWYAETVVTKYLVVGNPFIFCRLHRTAMNKNNLVFKMHLITIRSS